MWVYPCMEVYPPPTPIWKYTHICGYTPIWGVYTYMCYTPLWGYTPQNLCATNLAYSSRFAYIWSKSGRLQSHMCAGGLKQPSTENKDCASSRVCKAKMQDTGRSTTNDTNKPTVQYQNYNMIRTTYLLTFFLFCSAIGAPESAGHSQTDFTDGHQYKRFARTAMSQL